MTRDTQPLTAEFLQSISDDSLHLIILPTEKCNFRCIYCYEDFAIGRMTEETIRSVEAFLHQRIPSLSRLFIEWFGGEPLLAQHVIWRLSRSVLLQIQATNPALKYEAGITTNGWYLDIKTAEELVGNGVVRAQISLDGPKELHDTSRRRISGTGSFERIHANLEAIHASSIPLSILLRVHLTPTNAHAMRPFVEYLRDYYLGDDRFSLLLTRVGHLGGPNDASFEILTDAEAASLIAELAGLSRVQTAIGKADRLDIMESNASGIDVCYAAKMNSFVIRANGRLAKCTVALSNSNNDIGRVNPDGSLTLFVEKVRPWIRGWFTGDHAALACPLEAIPSLRDSNRTQLPLLRQ